MAISVVPNIDFNLMHKDIMLEAGEDVTIRQWASTNYSNSSCSFSTPPPSMSTFIDRCVIIGIPVTITYAGTTSGSALLQGSYDALRAYPIASITNSCQVTINNNTMSMQVSDIVPALSHYIKHKKMPPYPWMLDKYAVYADGVAANNNPLGQYFNKISNDLVPRGAYPMVIVNGATASSITATIFEVVWLPPFLMESDEGLGFSNVRTMDFVWNFSSNLSRIVSHATSSATFSSVSVALNQPTLYMKYTTPKMGYVPRTLQYGSHEINRYPTSYSSALTPNSSATIVSTNMQLNAIPSHMYLFVREANANQTYASTDTYAVINGINLSFNNVSGIMSSASEMDIYNTSKQNGLQDDWEEYHGVIANMGTQVGTVGSVAKLAFGKDITLHSSDYVGKIGAYNLQVNVSVTNRNQSVNITSPTLYIVTITPSTLTIHESGHTDVILGVTPLTSGQYIPYSAINKYYGGSFRDFIGKVGRFLSPINNFLKKTGLVSKITGIIPLPGMSTVSSVAKSLGYGEDGECGEGGRVMSRAELKRRMKKM